MSKFLGKRFFFRAVACLVNFCFIFFSLSPVRALAQSPADLGLPVPGAMVNLTPAYVPVIAKGLRIHPENPLLFDFIVDTGNSGLNAHDPALKAESEKVIKYFLASLTIPDQDQWVNLSPYEKDRIIPNVLGQTEMGRDMLAQDYILKQLTASLIYPEKNIGREFWRKVYAQAQAQYGTSQIPVNTFNKVWIVADKADVYVHNNTAFVVGAHLKVMLEEDYLALNRHSEGVRSTTEESKAHTIASQIVREIVLPQLENEVNTGKNFANLRQIFYSMILSVWYKKNLKEALLNQVYSDKAKINGVDVSDRTIKEQIYQQYLKAYKKGVFNYIKDDVDQASKQSLSRRYFSGGVGPSFDLDPENSHPGVERFLNASAAMPSDDHISEVGALLRVRIAAVENRVRPENAPAPRITQSPAMSATVTKIGETLKIRIGLWQLTVDLNSPQSLQQVVPFLQGVGIKAIGMAGDTAGSYWVWLSDKKAESNVTYDFIQYSAQRLQAGLNRMLEQDPPAQIPCASVGELVPGKSELLADKDGKQAIFRFQQDLSAGAYLAVYGLDEQNPQLQLIYHFPMDATYEKVFYGLGRIVIFYRDESGSFFIKPFYYQDNNIYTLSQSNIVGSFYTFSPRIEMSEDANRIILPNITNVRGDDRGINFYIGDDFQYGMIFRQITLGGLIHPNSLAPLKMYPYVLIPTFLSAAMAVTVWTGKIGSKVFLETPAHPTGFPGSEWLIHVYKVDGHYVISPILISGQHGWGNFGAPYYDLGTDEDIALSRVDAVEAHLEGVLKEQDLGSIKLESLESGIIKAADDAPLKAALVTYRLMREPNRSVINLTIRSFNGHLQFASMIITHGVLHPSVSVGNEPLDFLVPSINDPRALVLGFLKHKNIEAKEVKAWPEQGTDQETAQQAAVTVWEGSLLGGPIFEEYSYNTGFPGSYFKMELFFREGHFILLPVLIYNGSLSTFRLPYYDLGTDRQLVDKRLLAVALYLIGALAGKDMAGVDSNILKDGIINAANAASPAMDARVWKEKIGNNIVSQTPAHLTGFPGSQWWIHVYKIDGHFVISPILSLVSGRGHVSGDFGPPYYDLGTKEGVANRRVQAVEGYLIEALNGKDLGGFDRDSLKDGIIKAANAVPSKAMPAFVPAPAQDHFSGAASLRKSSSPAMTNMQIAARLYQAYIQENRWVLVTLSYPSRHADVSMNVRLSELYRLFLGNSNVVADNDTHIIVTFDNFQKKEGMTPTVYILKSDLFREPEAKPRWAMTGNEREIAVWVGEDPVKDLGAKVVQEESSLKLLHNFYQWRLVLSELEGIYHISFYVKPGGVNPILTHDLELLCSLENARNSFHAVQGYVTENQGREEFFREGHLASLQNGMTEVAQNASLQRVAIDEPARASPAMAPGGIDLTAKDMAMTVDGEKINIKFNPVMIAQFRRGDFLGVHAVILEITPIASVYLMLGLRREDEEGRLASV